MVPRSSLCLLFSFCINNNTLFYKKYIRLSTCFSLLLAQFDAFFFFIFFFFHSPLSLKIFTGKKRTDRHECVLIFCSCLKNPFQFAIQCRNFSPKFRRWTFPFSLICLFQLYVDIYKSCVHKNVHVYEIETKRRWIGWRRRRRKIKEGRQIFGDTWACQVGRETRADFSVLSVIAINLRSGSDGRKFVLIKGKVKIFFSILKINTYTCRVKRIRRCCEKMNHAENQRLSSNFMFESSYSYVCSHHRILFICFFFAQRYNLYTHMIRTEKFCPLSFNCTLLKVIKLVRANAIF